MTAGPDKPTRGPCSKSELQMSSSYLPQVCVCQLLCGSLIKLKLNLKEDRALRLGKNTEVALSFQFIMCSSDAHYPANMKLIN